MGNMSLDDDDEENDQINTKSKRNANTLRVVESMNLIPPDQIDINVPFL